MQAKGLCSEERFEAMVGLLTAVDPLPGAFALMLLDSVVCGEYRCRKPVLVKDHMHMCVHSVRIAREKLNMGKLVLDVHRPCVAPRKLVLAVMTLLLLMMGKMLIKTLN